MVSEAAQSHIQGLQVLGPLNETLALPMLDSRSLSSIGASASGSKATSTSHWSDVWQVQRRRSGRGSTPVWMSHAASTAQCSGEPLTWPSQYRTAAKQHAVGPTTSQHRMPTSSRSRRGSQMLAAAAASGPASNRGASRRPPPGQQPPVPRPGLLGGDDSWRTAYDDPDGDDNDYLSLSQEEIQERLLEAAGLVSIILDVRPLHPKSFNASLEVWKRIRRVPPWERHRILEDLEPGAIRALWKASMARYVLSDERAYDLAQDYSIWQDFPEALGQVYTYLGRCEQYVIAEPQIRFFTEEAERQKAAGEAPLLKSSQSSAAIQAKRFKMLFFVQPGTGELFARVVLPWLGPWDRWWEPCYLKLKMELTLTPLKVDAGADFTFEYAHPGTEDLNEWLSEDMLQAGHLPQDAWPAPALEDACGSPFSLGPRDYVRVAAPGLYVGCAYRGSEGLYSEDECVYFAIAHKMSKEEYIRQMEAAQAEQKYNDAGGEEAEQA